MTVHHYMGSDDPYQHFVVGKHRHIDSGHDLASDVYTVGKHRHFDDVIDPESTSLFDLWRPTLHKD